MGVGSLIVGQPERSSVARTGGGRQCRATGLRGKFFNDDSRTRGQAGPRCAGSRRRSRQKHTGPNRPRTSLILVSRDATRPYDGRQVLALRQPAPRYQGSAQRASGAEGAPVVARQEAERSPLRRLITPTTRAVSGHRRAAIAHRVFDPNAKTFAGGRRWGAIAASRDRKKRSRMRPHKKFARLGTEKARGR